MTPFTPVALRPTAWSRLIPSTLLAFLILGACRAEAPQGDPDLTMAVRFSPTPPGVGPARILIALEDSGGIPVEGAQILVEGNMSHAGMTPVLDTAVAEAPGRYAVPDFRFTMAGSWILTLRATLPDGRWTETVRTTDVARGPSGGGRP